MRFADRFDRIVGIDPEIEMLQEANRLEQELRHEHFSLTATLSR